VVYGMIPILFD